MVASGNVFDYSSAAYSLSYGKAINKQFWLGSTLRYLNNDFSSTNNVGASGFEMDLGAVYKAGDSFQAGIVLKNILSDSVAWTNGTKEDIPFSAKLGVTYSPYNNFSLAVDSDISSVYPALYHGGIEFRPSQQIALRCGLDQTASNTSSPITNFSLGAGFNYHEMSFDYAYYHDTFLTEENSTHYFSISLSIPVPETKSKQTSTVKNQIKNQPVSPKSKPASSESKAVQLKIKHRKTK